MNIIRTVARISHMATCAHGNFEYVSATDKVAIGRCRKCKSIVTAAPRSPNYEKIVAAKKRKRGG